MKIDLNYIEGVCDCALDLYQQSDGYIEADKELKLTYEQVWSSSKTQIIGTKVTFTWRTWVSTKWDKEDRLNDNYIIASVNDKLSSFIADVSSALSDIHKQSINY